ncbi:MAG: TSUP family transporter, partial [Rhodospirillales bacterium]
VLTAIALGQVFQIPVGLFATLRNWQSGIIDFRLGFLIAVCLLIGVFFGARFSAAINATAVKKILAVVLIGTSIVLFGRLLF